MEVGKKYRAIIMQSIYQGYDYYVMQVGDEFICDEITDKRIMVNYRGIRCFIFYPQIENFELVE